MQTHAGYRVVALGVAAVMAAGCAHALEIKNIGLYKPMFVNNLSTNLNVGLSASTSRPEEDQFVMAVANNLKRDGFRVTYPYFPSSDAALFFRLV